MTGGPVGKDAATPAASPPTPPTDGAASLRNGTKKSSACGKRVEMRNQTHDTLIL